MLRPVEVSLLILGAGWTSQFLIPQLEDAEISFAATTTTGRDGTIKYKFEPDSNDIEPYKLLPKATTILITFPLKGEGQSEQLTALYGKTHGGIETRWIQLGSTGIFTAPAWNDENSEHDKTNARAIAEDELLGLGGCILNLSGLYGGERQPRNWVTRVAKTQAEVKGKKALHLIHGDDVARAIIATHKKFTPGKRWLLTDLHVYDWWDLIYEWAEVVQEKNAEMELKYRKWVLECMNEDGVKALPREKESLGRVLDSRAFWAHAGTWPSRGRVH